jgi:hypothetical protein
MKKIIISLLVIGCLFTPSIASVNALVDENQDLEMKVAMETTLYIKTSKFEVEHCHTYDELTEVLGQLQLKYPEIFNYTSIGKTWEDRDIWLVKISDNVNWDEEETEVFFNGGMHGCEKNAYEVVIYAIKAFVENYTFPIVSQSFTDRVRNVINNTEIYIIPMLNPDGVEAGTRKNARPNNCLFGKTLFKGVDIARNSGYKWEVHNQHPLRYCFSWPYMDRRVNVRFPIFDTESIFKMGVYRGPSPFSEPETRALKYVIENNNISIFVDSHGVVERGAIFYGWAWNHDLPIPNESLMASIAEGVQDITNYNIIRGANVRSFGIIRDWMLAEHGVLAFTLELPKERDNVPFPESCKKYVHAYLYFAERAMILD